jgi:hypothetical protein
MEGVEDIWKAHHVLCAMLVLLMLWKEVDLLLVKMADECWRCLWVAGIHCVEVELTD